MADGSRHFLSRDPVDDIVLQELWTTYQPLFYPPEMEALPPDCLALDAGGHHGAYAVTTLLRYPRMRLISVEPDPSGFRTLARNISQNALGDRCELVEAAITDSDGDFLLEQSDEGSWGNSVVRTTGARPTNRIRGISLPTLLKGRRIHLLKSNCEGGEYSLIPQMLALEHLPSVVVLLLHPDGGREHRLLVDLAAAGYDIRPTCTSESHPRFVCLLH